MAVSIISIQLDNDAARIYTAASASNKEKLRTLLSFWLREFDASSIPLTTLMDKISDKAQARGLSPEILEALLDAS